MRHQRAGEPLPIHDSTMPRLSSLSGKDVGAGTGTDTGTERGNEQSATARPSHLLRPRLALLAMLLLFLCGSVTWLLWPDVVAALSIAPSPLPAQQRHAAPLHRIAPTLTPAQTPSPTASTWVALAQDTFHRPDQALWGDASSGEAWGADANAASAFAIVNGTGRITNQRGKHLYAAIIGPQMSNVDIACTFSVQDADHANVGVTLHWHNAAHWVRATLNGTFLIISQMGNGHLSRLAESPFALQNGVAVTLRFRAEQGVLEASAWTAGGPAPTTWMLMLRDPALAEDTGSGGIIAALHGSNMLTVTSFLETGVKNANTARVSEMAARSKA
jgi:hypothetical protein